MASNLSDIVAEAGANFTLLWPLALTQIATAAIGITDILMMGWLGPAPLAAGTLSVHFFTIISVMFGGLLTSASPLMAHRVGADRYDDAKRILGQSLKIAAALSVVLTFVVWHTPVILGWLGQPAALAQLGADFTHAMAVGFGPAIFMLLLRNYAAACGRPNLGLPVLFLGIVTNAFGNYVLMFGEFGFPTWGLMGAGAATSLSYFVMMFAIIFLIQRKRKLRLTRAAFIGLDHIGELLKLGIPISLMGLALVGTFLAATMAIGIFGTSQIAGHAIALQSANVGFALLWGGAQATTVRVGWAVGAGKQAATERAAWVGMGVGLIVSTLLATVVFFGRHEIVDLFLDIDSPDNQSTVTIALTIMMITAAYQLANGPQLVASSALRGLKDMRIPMLVILITYWIGGSSAAYLFAFVFELRAAGIWLGLTLAVAVSATIMTWRLRRMLPGAIERLAN